MLSKERCPRKKQEPVSLSWSDPLALLHGVMAVVDCSLSSAGCIGSVNRPVDELLSPSPLPGSVGSNYQR